MDLQGVFGGRGPIDVLLRAEFATTTCGLAEFNDGAVICVCFGAASGILMLRLRFWRGWKLDGT